ncbi:MAG: laccase domain-containing protein, partial [Bdellovibrionales bacterium]|nr:laccase domain-containing protein [Bdellovibrionales bacterium]
MSTFELTNAGGIEYYHYAPWTEEGIVHGFIGRSKGNFEQTLTALLDYFSIDDVVRAKQTHSNKVYKVSQSSQLPEADALVVSRDLLGKLCVIVTADCLPLLCKNQHHFGLIHAGWR